MHKTLLSALAAATLFAGGTFADRTAAMPLAAPPNGMALVEKAAIICGGNGCAPVQIKQIQRKKFQPLGYTKPLPQGALPQSTLPPKL
jgi:hypothetical protein